MPYITSVERLAKEEGVIEGRREGAIEGRREGTITTLQPVILDILALRFTTVPVSLGESLAQIDDVESLRELYRQTITVSSVEQFQQLLDPMLVKKKDMQA